MPMGIRDPRESVISDAALPDRKDGLQRYSLMEVVELIAEFERRFGAGKVAEVPDERQQAMQALLSGLKALAARLQTEDQQERQQVMDDQSDRNFYGNEADDSTIMDRVRNFLDRKFRLSDAFKGSGQEVAGPKIDWDREMRTGVSGEAVLTKAVDLVALSLEKGAKPLL